MESSIEPVIYPEIDVPVFLSEPTTEGLDYYVHEESLRPSTPNVPLAHRLLKYYEKIR